MSRRGRWAAAGTLAVAAVLAVGVVAQPDPEATFCTTEGLIGPGGEVYGRTGPRCQFADADGRLATHRYDGTAICYDRAARLVPCGQPGARPPG